MRRLPVLATILVVAAVAVMIWLGVWQLQRLHWKQDLLARYAAAQGLPTLRLPIAVDARNPPLFRRASARCERVAGWRAESGRNLNDEPGWLHIASCSAGDGGDVEAVMGWSVKPDAPSWSGGPVAGVIGSDRAHIIRLYATTPAPGLLAAKPPSLDDVPNNHLFYAFQWFFFAGAAALIYVLALRRRG